MFSGVHGVSHTTKRKWFLHGNQSSSTAPKRTYKADEAQQNISKKKNIKKEEEMINENLLESARVSNSSHLSIVKVHILALSPLAWTWTTTHVPLSIGKVFSPFLSFNSSVIHVNIETPPPSQSFSDPMIFRFALYNIFLFFLSFFLLSLVGSKWDCGANTLHDLRNDTFLAEMDIKGASRSGSIAPHLLDLFNEDGCSYRPIQCSFGISHRNVFSLFQFRN